MHDFARLTNMDSPIDDLFLTKRLRNPRAQQRALAVVFGVALLATSGCQRSTTFDNPVDSLQKTTAGRIVANNLSSEIAHWQAQLARDNGANLPRYSRLQANLLVRAQFELRMDDYVAAHTVAERAVSEHPAEAGAWLLLANGHSAVHRYGEAKTALTKATTLLDGPNDPAAAAIAARACQLTRTAGDYTAALRCAGDAVTAAPSASSHGEYASLLAELGRYDEAQAHFTKAWASYRQPSPLIPAWLALAQSKALQDTGKDKAAAALLVAMQARLPEHLRLTVETAVALESIGKRSAAIAMLEPLLQQTEDPDVPNLLASWLADEGDTEAAATMTARAASGFATHMAALPAAYAAHAAEFYAGAGNDLSKAYQLATQNAENAPTVPALSQLVEIGEQAERGADACQLARRLMTNQTLRAARPDLASCAS